MTTTHLLVHENVAAFAEKVVDGHEPIPRFSHEDEACAFGYALVATSAWGKPNRVDRWTATGIILFDLFEQGMPNLLHVIRHWVGKRVRDEAGNLAEFSTDQVERMRRGPLNPANASQVLATPGRLAADLSVYRYAKHVKVLELNAHAILNEMRWTARPDEQQARVVSEIGEALVHAAQTGLFDQVAFPAQQEPRPAGVCMSEKAHPATRELGEAVDRLVRLGRCGPFTAALTVAWSSAVDQMGPGAEVCQAHRARLVGLAAKAPSGPGSATPG